MINREKMHTGEIYQCDDPELLQEQKKRMGLLYEFNRTAPWEEKKRAELLKKMLAEIGEGCYIEPPFHANWAGKFLHFGKKVYANFNLTIVDDTHIYVGDYTMFGPNVVLDTGTHPVDPGLRMKGYQYNRPIYIGKNCWIGAGSVVLPGVSIGAHSVIGAGSVVTENIPERVVAAGVPCRVIRSVDGKK
ncbi:MAG: sugar O-acetyltransferase [Ruminococcus sp.]